MGADGPAGGVCPFSGCECGLEEDKRRRLPDGVLSLDAPSRLVDGAERLFEKEGPRKDVLFCVWVCVLGI